jgi:23S rRNA (uracil1939-C5)-methyltransferase
MQPKTRRRTDLKVSINHNTVEIGYCKQYSHAIINITECHVLEPVIFNLLPALKEMILGLDEPRLVTELSVLNSDSGIDLVIRTTSWATITDLERLVEFANNQDLARISWQNSEQLHLVCCRRSVLLKHNNASVPIMAGSFLQATKQAETIITELVVQYTTGYKSIVDLYAGFGTYSFPMRDYANVHAVEGSKIMVEAIKTAVKDYPAEHTLTAKSQDIFKYPLQPAE